jgi:SulP family sulfate permease
VAILVFLAFTGLGNAVKFIPRPIVIGFTNGIALLIALTQVKDFFGLGLVGVPSEFFARVAALASHFRTLDIATLLLALLSLAVILLVPRFAPRIPGSIAALVGATAAVMLFRLPVPTIGTSFGGIPSGLPHFHVPAFRPELIGPLLPSAVTVAILAAVESLLSAVVADSMIGDRHNSSAELMAQGVANLVSPLVGGIPVTGAIARTATNFRSGARTPVAGMVHALTLLVVLLVLAPLARFVPLATLAAVLVVVAYNMSEWREVRFILRAEAADIAVWAATFLLTVVADLTVAVEIGMALAALLYIYRVSQTTTVSAVTPEYIEEGKRHILQYRELPGFASILRIHGPFLFGTTDKLAEHTADLSKLSEVVILRLRNMTAIDATGLHALEVFYDRLRAKGRSLILCGACKQPAAILRQAAFVDHIGARNIVPHVQDALARARKIHEEINLPARSGGLDIALQQAENQIAMQK